MGSADRKRGNIVEMICLKSLVGVTLIDRVWNEDLRKCAGGEKQLTGRVDHKLLRWFRHMVRVDE